MEEQEHDVEIVLLGDSGSGKSTFINSLAKKHFSDAVEPSTPDTGISTAYRNNRVKLKLLSLGPSTNSERLRSHVYGKVHICFLCFDICDVSSFKSIRYAWYQDLLHVARHSGAREFIIVLVGLKSDLRLVTLNKDPYYLVNVHAAREMARQIGAFAYVECSAHSHETMQKVVRVALRLHYKKGFGKNLAKNVGSKKERSSSFLQKMVLNFNITLSPKLRKDEKRRRQRKEKEDKPKPAKENIRVMEEKLKILQDKSNYHNPFLQLPCTLVHKICLLLFPPQIAKMSSVCRVLYSITLDRVLWNKWARSVDTTFDVNGKRDPKKHYTSLARVWYNDFTVPKDPPDSSYVFPGHDRFRTLT